MDLKSKREEISAAESRLLDMERDLVEMTLTNDDYRSRMAELGAKLDITKSELAAAKNGSETVAGDLTEMNDLVTQLNEQKVKLNSNNFATFCPPVLNNSESYMIPILGWCQFLPIGFRRIIPSLCFYSMLKYLCYTWHPRLLQKHKANDEYFR